MMIIIIILLFIIAFFINPEAMMTLILGAIFLAIGGAVLFGLFLGGLVLFGG